MAARRRRGLAPIVAVSGPSGVGKTRLLARLVSVLVSRGVRVGILKHTGHPHAFDVPGKDTDVLRRAGAVAAAIQGPAGMAYFGPPAGGARALARMLPPVDLVLAEGWKREPLPRVEVHRTEISPEFLCATDRRVLAIVTDAPPPRAVPAFGADDTEPLADLLCARFGIARPRRGPARLRVRPSVSSVAAEGSERTIALGRRAHMAKTTKRRSGKTIGTRRSTKRGTRSRSAAGRKGGTATLRARGPEFYSEIGRKGGKSRAASTKRSRSGGSRSRTASGGSRRSSSGSRSSGTRRSTRRSSRSR